MVQQGLKQIPVVDLFTIDRDVEIGLGLLVELLPEGFGLLGRAEHLIEEGDCLLDLEFLNIVD